jgi:hypothetical protein
LLASGTKALAATAHSLPLTRYREGHRLGVVLPGGQAVVELAEEAVEQVAQRRRVTVAGCSAAVVVDPCPG